MIGWYIGLGILLWLGATVTKYRYKIFKKFQIIKTKNKYVKLIGNFVIDVIFWLPLIVWGLVAKK